MGIFPIIPLIWFVFISSAGSLQFRDNPLNSVDAPLKPYERHLIRRAVKDVPLNSTDSSIKEFHHNLTRRATKEELSKSVNQMHMISRIINGIYLQQSLANKTIPSEELISELLNIGSLTTAQIVGINGAKLTTVVDQINQLSTKLSATKDIKAVETQIFLSASIANEVKGLDGKFSIPTNHKYLNEVDRLAEKYEGLKVSVLIKRLMGFLEGITSLDFDKEDETKAGTAFDNIERFVIYVQKLNGTSTNPVQSINPTELEEISKSGTLKSFETSFPFLLPLNDAFTKYKDNAAVLTKDNNKLIATFTDNIKSLGLMSKTSEEILPNLDYLSKAIVLRHHKHGNSVFKHIPGLINGISDINLISDDLGKEWVKQAVMGQAPNIFDSLILLGDLDKFSRLVVTSFGSGSNTDDMFKEISKINPLARKLSKLSTSPLAGKANNIKINVSGVNSSSLELFGTLISSMSRIRWRRISNDHDFHNYCIIMYSTMDVNNTEHIHHHRSRDNYLTNANKGQSREPLIRELRKDAHKEQQRMTTIRSTL